MPGCAVSNCSNYNKKTKGTGVKYFSFPKDFKMCNKWFSMCNRKDPVNFKNACICSIHFSEDAFDIPMQQRLLGYAPKTARRLKPDAMPTLNLPNRPENVEDSVKKRKREDREHRAIKRSRRAVLKDILSSSPSSLPASAIIETVENQECSVGERNKRFQLHVNYCLIIQLKLLITVVATMHCLI
ncbi:hypothetical protein ABEB36_015181 [Hypothenemus hampei]|uniref:THAP-type domain-containing protein n=1 Tax=Hypothenemus hampei TaxID=57062 RepID=A0ABD1E0L9_HYPHA